PLTDCEMRNRPQRRSWRWIGAGFCEIRLRVLLHLDGLGANGSGGEDREARDFLQQLGRMQRLREQAEADASFACLQQQVIGGTGEEEYVACGEDLFRLYGQLEP